MNRNRCPTCDYRLHPLELADIFRGRRRRCRTCGANLYAAVPGHLSLLTALAAGLWPVAEAALFPGNATYGPLLLAAGLLGALMLTPPGLVAEAPWVRIYASHAGRAGLARRRTAIEAMRRKSTPEDAE